MTPPDEPAAAGRITVSRTDERDVQQRRIRVSIDDRPIAGLAYGESVSREVPAGRHRLEVWNTLVRKRLELDLAPGEHARFTTANRAGFGAWLIALLGVGPIYVTLERDAAEPPPGGVDLAR